MTMFNQEVFQCYASFPMERHFAKGLRDKWKLTEYHDPHSPTVIFGWYDNKDFEIIKNHKSYIIMLWGGADMINNRIKYIRDREKCYQFGYGWQSDILNNLNVKHKSIALPFKSYDNFVPTPLGDKIYVYRGWKVPRNDYFNWESFVTPLFNILGKERFIYGMDHDMQYVHENFYKQCFVYLKPNVRGGSTSMWELGHMGRKTISANQGGAPNVLEAKGLNQVIELINQEYQKVGTLQNEVAEKTKAFLTDDYRWLDLNWYEKNF